MKNKIITCLLISMISMPLNFNAEVLQDDIDVKNSNSNEAFTLVNELNENDTVVVQEQGIIVDEKELKEAVADIDVNELKNDLIEQGIDKDVVNNITKQNLDNMYMDSINIVNAEIESGNLEVQDGDIIDSSDDNYYIQGGSTYVQ